ncbi:hypothetical protein SmJEL517_g00146 [Synchytrium microbalum]|uniref:Uncharacterized protein n=1 Tax=Synchytrium microbalum TaxID=1806994 RepID=A0A507CJV5_9FUNG|nr:uncharacterized protein SmJEL517_g00146 [Synchytrium microbalum]TPX38145.1 hypothetical protein SmJEL517_g00146 [Synchytrium microbalum]
MVQLSGFTDVIVTKEGPIGQIKFNRPKSLNAFGGMLVLDTLKALRDFDKDPSIIFTVITGEGRFFSSGADVRAFGSAPHTPAVPTTELEGKVAYINNGAVPIELVRAMIDHKKVLIMALNGGAVGGGCAWFLGAADIVLATQSAYLQVPFSALALVPEMGSRMFAEHVGVRRTTEFLMFGRKINTTEMLDWGIVNQVFPDATFKSDVAQYLATQLEVNDHKSMLETKRLIVEPLREGRINALFRAQDGLAEAMAVKRPMKRFAEKAAKMVAKSKSAKL